MRVFCTVGNGFVGSHVVDRLVKAHIETHVLVSGFRSKNHPSIVNREANVIEGDLRDYPAMEKATKGMDYVFHLASVLSHYCDNDPALTIDVNIKGTWNLKTACVKNKVDRVLFASSSFVYGEPQIIPVIKNHSTNPNDFFGITKLAIPVNENHPTNPKDILGITKLAAEKILQATHPNKIDYTILRLFNVYGPRSYPDKLYTSVMSTWINKALQKQSLEIHADGKQSLDFIYVEDVAQAFIDCMNETAKNQIFNVGSGTTTSMNRLAELINRITCNTEPSHYNTKHPAYLKLVQADIQKIENYVDWHPKVNLTEGLEKTVQFFKERKQ